MLPRLPEVPFSLEETSDVSVCSSYLLSLSLEGQPSFFLDLASPPDVVPSHTPALLPKLLRPSGSLSCVTVLPPALLRTTSGSLCFLLSLLPRLGGGSPPRFLSSLCQKTLHKQAPKSGYSLFSHISFQILTPGWWISPRTGWFYPSNLPLPHQSLSTFTFHRTPG